MRKEKIVLITLVVVVCLVTFFVRVPLPSRGYFNVGDIAVVFAGLLLGRMSPGTGFWKAFIAGGVGSALADVLGGWALFAPLTLVAKGFEGMMAALAVNRAPAMQAALLGAGGLAMISVYFVGEVFMPSIGIQGAVAEVVPNLIQAVGGAVGGRLAFAAYGRIAEKVTV